MKKFVACFILCTILLNGAAQTDGKISIGSTEKIHSTILNEDRTVWVYLPGSLAGDVSSSTKYPVVYLLDGETHFYSVVGLIQQLSSANGNTVFPEMIVVGIRNTDRRRDFTPTHVASPFFPLVDSSFASVSGGGSRFFSFVEKELIPYIESKYPTQPYRMLIGHSLGGLAVMDALLNHTELFSSYVAIDPSAWWDSGWVLQQAPKVLPQKSFEGKSLFLGIANTMPRGMDVAAAKKDTSLFTSHFRCVLKLDTLLRQNQANHLKYASKYYSDESHTTVPLIAEYDALHSIFDYYTLNLTPEDFMTFSEETLKRIENHYEVISKNLGYTICFPEMMASGLGYALLGQRRLKESELVFSANVRNYPNSYSVHDAMGDYYSVTGKLEKAVACYTKALSIKELPTIRKKLDVLTKK
ncbi:alpha/beta hydrolase-fold protein [uncultured Acetobacteroides sp.]|uniref:alpha/beta hydrolase-fold protein n=1 Tax=uncultured Acetobacteroides sp. TaxID=1760811 RepID=UPI0029F48D5F|nr:alpha/beta hydrolase-fold protein [uncultured Acetobacteroides sp.]